MPLLELADCVLIVVDAQPGFSGTNDEAREAATQSRAVAAWLVRVAAGLGIPIVVTEEDPAKNGPTDPSITTHLPPETPIFDKAVFGLAGVPEILAVVESTGRRTAILAGAETDVCVAQSAIGLRDRGFRVAVVSDATFSPGAMHGHGLDRMRGAGVEIQHAKGVYYEWLRTVEVASAFKAAHPDVARPPGFDL